MFQATVYKIMIGAPSDIEEEIDIAKRVLYEWNKINSEKETVVLLPLHWADNAYPEVGSHPQKTINKQVVEKSDLFVCIFATRIGSPTDTFISGTIEEIEEHRKAGKQVMIFFNKSISNIGKNVDNEQLEKLKSFQASIQRDSLYFEFQDATDFEKIFSQKLQLYVNDRILKNKNASNNFNNSELAKLLSIEDELSESFIDKLKLWVKANDNKFINNRSASNGFSIYEFGGQRYNVINAKEQADWEDFFEKLQKFHFIEFERKNQFGLPIYKLKKIAFDFVKQQPCTPSDSNTEPAKTCQIIENQPKNKPSKSLFEQLQNF